MFQSILVWSKAHGMYDGPLFHVSLSILFYYYSSTYDGGPVKGRVLEAEAAVPGGARDDDDRLVKPPVRTVLVPGVEGNVHRVVGTLPPDGVFVVERQRQ